MAVLLLNISDAYKQKTYSNDIFRARLLDLLSEAKQRGLLNDNSEESQEEIQKRKTNYFADDDSNERLHVRRKIVGLSDDPI
ncbi:unnamed protein product [Adineta steineri]|nr:unnamed protein product [Adineta steineri]CAF3906992.1 unnamed protein product [Adineta steineri]